MDRYVCIHGHFYQPPRENPWLEAIELQDSAAPYHDWNERITRECYAPNSVSRILDDQERIVKLVNNYARISFNFGPTLLSWLEVKAPEVYAAVLAADQQSRATFSGHGSAIAQVYNHVIMPLATRRDRVTQIRWGIGDFEHRFGRAPEGMWLAETAVDLETLELLAGAGIGFTILAPHQAARVRALGDKTWQEINGATIDTALPYRQRLPSGRSIAIFFYNGAIARAVAFEGLLSQGEQFIERLVGAFVADRAGPQLVHIATDGESYGHHHRFGDMALAYGLEQIPARQLAQLTNYGEYLEKHPPRHEVEIVEKSSWSCAHGIDRWWTDCGCNTGGHATWNQKWRTPLRNALDWLRDQVAPQWERQARQFFGDPWAVRDDYIKVLLDRSPSNVANFYARHAARPLTPAQTTTAIKLLELQRHAMLMYTSCGWFFDDLAGIETIQVLQLCRPRRATGPGLVRRFNRRAFHKPPRSGPEQSARSRRRRTNLPALGTAGQSGLAEACGALRAQQSVRRFSRARRGLLLRCSRHRAPSVKRGSRQARRRPSRADFEHHSGIGTTHLHSAASGRS